MRVPHVLPRRRTVLCDVYFRVSLAILFRYTISLYYFATISLLSRYYFATLSRLSRLSRVSLAPRASHGLRGGGEDRRQ